MHYPGDNYLGPGTNIEYNIRNKIRPKTYNDFVALKHDIDYLRAGHLNATMADLKAMWRSKSGLDGVAMRTGLGARTILDNLLYLIPFSSIHEITHFNAKTDNEELRQELSSIVTNNSWDFEPI